MIKLPKTPKLKKLKMPKINTDRLTELFSRRSSLTEDDDPFQQPTPTVPPTRRRKRRRNRAQSVSLPSLPTNLSPKGLLYSLFGIILLVVVAIGIVTMVQDMPKKPTGGNDDKIDFGDIEGPKITKSYTYTYDKFGTEAMVEYDGEIEVLSFGPVVGYPHEAFSNAERSKEFDETSLTPAEFTAILQSLYDKKYIVVSMNDIWEEGELTDGTKHMQRKPLKVPKGRIPIVLVFKGENFTEELMDYGYAQKFVQQDNGEIWASAYRNGHLANSTLINAITLMDDFCKKNNNFCLGGAKGCIALTGVEGLFGYDSSTSNLDEKDRQTAIVYAKSIIRQLKKTGWYFGCYTYSGINIQSSDYTTVIGDLTNWVNEVGLLIGSTDILIYPTSYGTALPPLTDGDTFEYMQNLGFNIYISEGTDSSYRNLDFASCVLYTDMTVDGFSLRWSREQFMHLFDCAQILDTALRPALPAGYASSAPTGTGDNPNNEQ